MTKDRYWSGWGEYRYGSRKKPKLAAVSLIRGEARKQMVTSVVEALKDWRFSEFEHEAGTRVALRCHFIGKGHGWSHSDVEASKLVSSAFGRLGARRPGFAEGQWQYTAPRDRCVRCNAEIEEAEQLSGYRYCSSICAKAAKEIAAVDQAHADSRILKRATTEIARRGAAMLSLQQALQE